jgi:hypothetical protein
VFLTAGTALAQERLLAELRTQGFCYECSPPVLMYDIGLFIRDSPSAGAGWSVAAGISDVGKSVDLPTNLLSAFNNVLTHNGLVDGNMNCCHGDVGTIYTDALTYGTQRNDVQVTRVAPVLGLNFSGYHITNVTMTIDRLEWIPIGHRGFRAESMYTVHIFGVPVPEPFALVQAMIGFVLALRVRLPRR